VKLETETKIFFQKSLICGSITLPPIDSFHPVSPLINADELQQHPRRRPLPHSDHREHERHEELNTVAYRKTQSSGLQSLEVSGENWF